MEYVEGKGGYGMRLDSKAKEAMAQRPNGEFKKKIADLQILDCLCAQTDRHMNNIMFRTDSNGAITDFKGIDNDMSFGITGVNTYGFHSINLSMIIHIDETTANHIKNLDKEVLEYRLKDLLV